MHYGVPNKGRLGSGVPHREPSVLHVIVEAVAGDLGASQASSQLSGEGGGADEGKSSCLMGVARGEREIARERHPEDGSVQSGEWHGLLEAGVQSSTSNTGVTPRLRGVGGGGGGVCLEGAGQPPALQEKTWVAHPGLTRLPVPVPDPPAAGAGLR